MSYSAYNIRNYQSSDFNKFVQLIIEAEELEPIGRNVSPQVIAESLANPGYSPEQDLFLIEIEGEVIGWLDIKPELTIKRVILYCWVHPEHRGKGLAKKLLYYATQRAKELGAKVAHVNISQDNETAKTVLSKLGFEHVRLYFELRLDIDKVHWENIDQAALGCRHLQPGEEAKLTRIQNRAFAEHWGYNPNTVEEIIYYTNLRNRSPEDVIVTSDGDKFIGYCWTEVNGGGEGTSNERKGLIYMIGTDPDYQGKGVGKRVLLAGLAHLRNKGLRVAELAVDSENKVACELYRSVGFEVRTTSLWYEKVIDQDTGAR